MIKHKTKVSFWATKCSGKFIDKRAEKIYHKLLKIEDEVTKLREEIFDRFTKPQEIKLKFFTRKAKRKYKKKN